MIAEHLVRAPLARASLILIAPGPAITHRGLSRRRRAAAAQRCREQLFLPLAFPSQKVTPLMQRVLDVIERLANACQPMPSNVKLADILTGHGRQSVAKAIDKLAIARLIKIETQPGQRRIHLVQSAKTTGWGEHRAGHAPYCRNPRGAIEQHAAPKQPSPLRRGDGFAFLGIPEQDMTAYKQALTVRVR